MDTRFTLGLAAALLVLGIVVFVYALKQSAAGYLILLACLIAAIARGMVAMMHRGNPPAARP
ncbi:MAG TPA: hypothetical protein VET65_14815 [Candidatus Limnocylindrales bacterium]|nr:hypothetical protein [Candidatus Limnocylindrales bacterium]